MLTIGTALLHITASVLGGLTSSIAVEWWHERQKASVKGPVKAAALSTAGVPRGRRKRPLSTGRWTRSRQCAA